MTFESITQMIILFNQHTDSAFQSSQSLCSSLPPANEVCGKVMFLHASVILSTGEGGVRAMHAPYHTRTPLCHACLPCHARPLPCMPLPHGYYEMRSMSGQYTSYWNAFLFMYLFVHFYKIVQHL